VERTGGGRAAPVARRRDAQHGRRQLLQLHLAVRRLIRLAFRGLRRAAAAASARRAPRRACLVQTAGSLAVGWCSAPARMRAAAIKRGLRAGGAGGGSAAARTRPARRARRFRPRRARLARAGRRGIPCGSAARCTAPAGSAACPGSAVTGLG